MKYNFSTTKAQDTNFLEPQVLLIKYILIKLDPKNLENKDEKTPVCDGL